MVSEKRIEYYENKANELRTKISEMRKEFHETQNQKLAYEISLLNSELKVAEELVDIDGSDEGYALEDISLSDKIIYTLFSSSEGGNHLFTICRKGMKAVEGNYIITLPKRSFPILDDAISEYNPVNGKLSLNEKDYGVFKNDISEAKGMFDEFTFEWLSCFSYERLVEISFLDQRSYREIVKVLDYYKSVMGPTYQEKCSKVSRLYRELGHYRKSPLYIFNGVRESEIIEEMDTEIRILQNAIKRKVVKLFSGYVEAFGKLFSDEITFENIIKYRELFNIDMKYKDAILEQFYTQVAGAKREKVNGYITSELIDRVASSYLGKPVEGFKLDIGDGNNIFGVYKKVYRNKLINEAIEYENASILKK